MDFAQLREFVFLAERLNFSETAKHLFIAQPVLSRHIADMEQQLGAQLFIRDKHSVQLTAIGKLFLKESRSLIEQYEKALQNISQSALGQTGNLKIGFLEASVNNFLAPLAEYFYRNNPRIQLQLFSFDSFKELNHALQYNEIDIGFTLNIGLSNSLRLSSQRIYRDVECAVVRSDHPLADKKLIDFTDLIKDPLIMLAQDQFPEVCTHIISLYKSRGLLPNTIHKSSRIDTLLMMIEMGLGIAILPRQHKCHANPNLRFIPLNSDDAPIEVVLAWQTSNDNSAILPFIEVVLVWQIPNINAECLPFEKGVSATLAIHL